MAEGQTSKSKESVNRVLTKDEQKAIGTAAVSKEVVSKAAETVEGIDDLLDEIDTVLEPNAQEFVNGYVQKGGE